MVYFTETKPLGVRTLIFRLVRQNFGKKREGLWSNRKLIKEFYILRDILSKKLNMEFEVDHVIPLQGDSISGLHSHLNLQVIPKKINRTKSNKIDLEEIDQMLIDAEKKYLTYRQLILKVKM